MSAQTYNTPFRGSMVKLATSLTGVTFPIVVPFDTVLYDTDTFWEAVNPTKFTIPTGVTKVRLYAGIEFNSVATAHGVFLSFLKNASTDFDGNPTLNFRQGTAGFTNNVYSLFSGPISVVAGDVFELRANTPQTVLNEIVGGTKTYMAVEVVEFAP